MRRDDRRARPRLQSRMQRPGARRPARPARCSADDAADRRHHETIEAVPRVEAGDAREPGVDHRGHALDGERRLGDVGREHDAPPRPGAQRALLLVERLIAVQRRRRRRAPQRARERLGGAADLAGAGQEDEHVARLARARRRASASATRVRRAAARRRRAAPTRSRPDGRGPPTSAPWRPGGTPRAPRSSSVADMTTSFRSGRTVSCSSRTTASATSPCRWRSWNSSRTTTPTSSRNGSSRQPAPEDALGDEPEPRRRRRRAARSERGSRPRRRPRRPRCAATNSAAARAAIRRGSSTTTVPAAGDAGVEERGGHARRLSRAGRRAQHEAPAAGERVAPRREQRIDRQRRPGCRALRAVG